MSRPKRCAIVFITLLVALLFGHTQNKAEQLPIRTYTTADGLARDRVYKIVPDPHGFLWFCTYDGLSRFDGYEFVNYSIEHGLPHRLVFDLLITRKGDYWVATSNGIAHFNPLANTSNPKFRSYVPTQRSTSEVILDLYEDSSGTIWAGSGNGLLRLHETDTDVQFEYVSLGEKSNEELEITTVVEDSPGVLWIGTETGLFRRYADGKAERFTVKNGLPHDHVRDILRDPDGTVWIATGLGLCRLRADVRAGDQIVSRVYTKKDYELTPHEVRLLRMLVEGHSYKTAAAELNVSVNTIKFHLRHIYDKLHVHTKSEAVAKALRHGLTR